MNLRCPENDVEMMANVLLDEKYGKFTDVIQLKNNTHYEALESMGEVFDRAGTNDLVLVYYSGHGKQDDEGQLYLATKNTKTTSSIALGNSSISVDAIRRNIKNSDTNKVILILDCCYSGAVDEAFQRGADPDVPLREVSDGQGLFILTASTKIQTAREKEGDLNGLLTKHILGGIKSGQADINNDGFIDMSELYTYVYEKVRLEGPQEPMRFALKMKGKELIIAKVPPQINHKEAVIEPKLNEEKLKVDLRKLEAVGGAIPLNSPYYVIRDVDDDFLAAIEKHESIVLVKGARQIGKTSLLARGLQKARETESAVISIDFQNLNFKALTTIDDFFRVLANLISRRLGLPFSYDDCWDKLSEGTEHFRDFVIQALNSTPKHMVWGMDEVDRLFSCSYGSEVFGAFRAFHNARAIEPDFPWNRLTLAMAYATEARLFIKDQNQSPFNVGIRLELQDFSLEEVDWLNNKIKEECNLFIPPLRNEDEKNDFYSLLNGHPFLVRASLDAMVRDGVTWYQYKNKILSESGLFGEHLHRILELLKMDVDMRAAVKSIVCEEPLPEVDSEGEPFPKEEIFYRLERSGLISGKSIEGAEIRCTLYKIYLQKHLGCNNKRNF